MKGTTLSSRSRKRSFTLSSPFQLSLCVLRSMNTEWGGRLPYLCGVCVQAIYKWLGHALRTKHDQRPGTCVEVPH